MKFLIRDGFDFLDSVIEALTEAGIEAEENAVHKEFGQNIAGLFVSGKIGEAEFSIYPEYIFIRPKVNLIIRGKNLKPAEYQGVIDIVSMVLGAKSLPCETSKERVAVVWIDGYEPAVLN